MPTPRFDPRRDYPPQFGGGGSYRTGDSVADILLRSGQNQADIYRQQGDAWSNTIGSLAGTFGDALKRREADKAQKAVELATSEEYPSATKPVAGSAADVPDPGSDHIQSILGRLSPEMRPRVQASIQAAQATAMNVQKTRQALAEGQRKLQQEAADHWFVVANGLEPHLKDEDGGITAATLGTGPLSAGVPGQEKIVSFAQRAKQAYDSAPDPQSKAQIADAFRQQVGPMIQQGKAGGSLDAQKKWADLQKSLIDTKNAENPPGVALPDNGLVNPRTGAVIAPGPGKETSLQHVETAQGIQTFDPKKGTLGPVIAQGKPANMGGMNGLYKDVDPKAIAEAIKRGEQPPVLTDLGRPVGAAVSSELAKSGYNLAAAATDWKATQKHIATLNGAQQLRLNQAINSLPDLLDTVDSLASQWKGGRFPVLNKANLALAKGGAYGSDVASVANKLDAQIADVNADLAVVYMGGNSPTDHGLSLASKSLAGDWDEKVLHDMVKMAKGNVTIRRNSILNTGVAGASAGNPYAPPPAGGPSAPPAGGEPTATGPNGQKLALRNGQWVPVQ